MQPGAWTAGLVALLLCVACSSPPPVYKIAYNPLLGAATIDYEIFVMDLGGSQKRNITNSPGLDWVFHAYGDRLFFVSDRDTCRRC